MASKVVLGEVQPVSARSCGGTGWAVNRLIGEGSNIDFLDPLLLIDEVKTQVSPAGVAMTPFLPYHGMLRVVYVVSGGVEWVARNPERGDKHGLAHEGDAFVLNANRGALCQLSPSRDVSLGHKALHLIEVWVKDTLQMSHKDPLVDTYTLDELPTESGDGWTARVVVGKFAETSDDALISSSRPSRVIDFVLQPGKTLEYQVPEGWNTIVYVIEGEVELQNNMELVHAGTLSVFETDGDIVEAWARGDGADASACRFLVVSGHPVHEPVLRDATLCAGSKQQMRELRQRPGFEEALSETAELRAAYKAAAEAKAAAAAAAQSARSLGSHARHGSQVSLGSPRSSHSRHGSRASLASSPQGSPRSARSLQSTPRTPGVPATALHADMVRYQAEFAVYSGKWTSYLEVC